MILELAQKRGIVTSKELRGMGVHPQSLKRLADSGRLVRVARGHYRLPDFDYPITEHHGLVLASVIVPHGVICLLSALHFHGIGTQLPRKVWIALPRASWTPRVEYPPLRVVHMAKSSFNVGIEEHSLEGQSVRVYDVAKTVVDCFRFRNVIGMDAALEALNESWRERRINSSVVAEYAQLCRVWTVLRPYLEAITA